MTVVAMFLPMSLRACLIKTVAVLFDLVQVSGELLSLLLVKHTITVLVVLGENFVEPCFEFGVSWHFLSL